MTVEKAIRQHDNRANGCAKSCAGGLSAVGGSSAMDGLTICLETGEFEGYASIFNVRDQHGDVVLPGAFKESLARWRIEGAFPKMLWQHVGEQVIGVWTHMQEDSCGLYVRGRLLLDVAIAREAHTLLLAKAIDSLSIGYRVVRATAGRMAGKPCQYLHALDVLEVSLVTFAANQLAKVVSAKHACWQQGHARLLAARQHDSVPLNRKAVTQVVTLNEIRTFCDYLTAQ